MSALSESRLVELLDPFLLKAQVPETLYRQLGVYLDLLLRWNSRMNLTAIRAPEEIVQRHFGESLFAGAHLQPHLPTEGTLLDLGSGAGFPGIPIQLLAPDLRVCLAESQGKKAAFLREVIRTLSLATEVWAARAETLPAARKFDCVALRAVDRMGAAMNVAGSLVSPDGILAILGSSDATDSTPEEFSLTAKFPVPGSHSRMLYLYSRTETAEG